MTKEKEPDLVPHYPPGTTEPVMVPRDSVEGVAAEGYAPEPVAEEPGDAAMKEPTKTVAKKK